MTEPEHLGWNWFADITQHSSTLILKGLIAELRDAHPKGTIRVVDPEKQDVVLVYTVCDGCTSEEDHYEVPWPCPTVIAADRAERKLKETHQ